MIARSHGTRELPSSTPEPDKADTNSPASSSPSPPPSEQSVMEKQLYPNQPRSLSGIALRAFLLGVTLTVSLALLVTGLVYGTPLWRIPFFFATLSAFHFLEFWVTARYNTPSANVSAFLLTANWPAYAIAHASATIECLLTNLLFPGASWTPGTTNWTPLIVGLGLVLVVLGQAVRTTGMVQCGESFNHIVQSTRKQSHFLVTHGVYAIERHPSYLGFFWWSLGTQLVLGNIVCFVGYAVVVWRFFAMRIPHEEKFLLGFFGDEFIEYRRRVRTWIPFVG